MATQTPGPLNQRGTMVIVERLELLSLPLWLWYAWRQGGGYFLGWSKAFRAQRVRRWVELLAGLRPLQYEEFPGSYYEVHRTACQGANDAFCDEAKTSHAAPALAFLRRFHDHALIEAALRRQTQDAYTVLRLKLLVFLRALLQNQAAILLIPQDNIDSRPWAPTPLGAAFEAVYIPRPVRVVNRIKASLEPLGQVVVAWLMVGVLLWKRGMVLAAGPPSRWRVGLQIFDEVLRWRPYRRTFLYDEADLAPEKILHVVPHGSEAIRRYFQTNGYPLVETERLPVPVGYFAGRVLPTFLGGVIRLAVDQIRCGGGGGFAWSALTVAYQVLKAELLDLYHQIDVFVGRDETTFAHLLRTVVYDRRGGVTVGFSQGDETYYDVASSYLGAHHFCFWGEFQRDLLRHNARFCRSTHIIGAGIYGLDETYKRIVSGTIMEPYLTLRRRARLIGAFTTSFGEDFIMNRAMALEWCEAVVALAHRYPDIVVVFKPKGDELDSPEFRDVLSRGGEKVVMEKTMCTYDLLPALDLVIGLGASSSGLDGLMAGKHVVYFDTTGLAEHPYASYAAGLVARSAAELYAAADRIMRHGISIEPSVLEHIQHRHGLAFDGRVTARFRAVVYAALEGTDSRAKKAMPRQSAAGYASTFATYGTDWQNQGVA
ncbi:MAG: hypothetical protein FJ245_05120 [Nitrospira sp.]|nr:hypothetical protein [Nitrospira sp.]